MQKVVGSNPHQPPTEERAFDAEKVLAEVLLDRIPGRSSVPYRKEGAVPAIATITRDHEPASIRSFAATSVR
jgi:hypothetical protein